MTSPWRRRHWWFSGRRGLGVRRDRGYWPRVKLHDRPLSDWGPCPTPGGRPEQRKGRAGGVSSREVLYHDCISLHEVQGRATHSPREEGVSEVWKSRWELQGCWAALNPPFRHPWLSTYLCKHCPHSILQATPRGGPLSTSISRWNQAWWHRPASHWGGGRVWTRAQSPEPRRLWCWTLTSTIYFVLLRYQHPNEAKAIPIQPGQMSSAVKIAFHWFSSQINSTFAYISLG